MIASSLRRTLRVEILRPVLPEAMHSSNPDECEPTPPGNYQTLTPGLLLYRLETAIIIYRYLTFLCELPFFPNYYLLIIIIL